VKSSTCPRNWLQIRQHSADHVDQNRRDFDAFYVDCDPDDLHADGPQTDADRMHDAIGDDFSAIVITADLVHALDAILHRDLKDWMLYSQARFFRIFSFGHVQVSKFGVFGAFELAS
jgi:hypothetical protein